MSRSQPDPRLRKAIRWPIAAMPAYTIGLLAPVPFLYAAARLHTRRLWWIAAAYGAAWIGTCILVGISSGNDSLGTVSGFLLMGLAAAGTTHAFALRGALPDAHDANAGGIRERQLGGANPAAADDAINLAQLQQALSSLKTYATSRAQLPPECARLLDETIVDMEQVLSFVARNGNADAEVRSVERILTDYLPTSLNTYERLPREFALFERNPDGRTAAEELELQLRLVRDSAQEAAGSIYRGDALRLEAQSAFLESKFGRSELDLN